MRRGFQLSLFGGGPGKGHLFEDGVLAQYLDEHRRHAIPNLDARAEALRDWLVAVDDTRATESSLEGGFVSAILANVLGYTPYPGAPAETATAYVKPASRITGIKGTPDVVLGSFSETSERFVAVLELKTPGADLDRPQPRSSGQSPVEQAFGYGTQILGVNWVLVSDMVKIRLYAVESEAEFEEFDLRRCLQHGSNEVTDEFHKLYWLLHSGQLVGRGEGAPVELIFRRTIAHQIRVRDGFYDAYYRIRGDLVAAIRTACESRDPLPTEHEVLLAAQRLLDRMLFLYYCEDHPEQLIPRNTVRDLVAAASRLPGAEQGRVYKYLKGLFREVDTGSPPTSGLRVLGYNGELFKHHPIIDEVDLPDTLATRSYLVADHDGTPRKIAGVWGLHVFDFWRDLNEHLLGHVFEESLSDLVKLANHEDTPLAEKLTQRKQHGIYYTSSLLADFLSASALDAVLNEKAPKVDPKDPDLEATLVRRKQAVQELLVIDLTCGSGAFLVAAYREMLLEYWRSHTSQDALRREADKSIALDVFGVAETISQAALLRHSLYGVDLLPQATEIAKLALWLRSAKKGEPVSDLSHNIVAGDALDLEGVLKALQRGLGEFDLVIGNPPWGAEAHEDTQKLALELLGLPMDEQLDTWEVFTLLGMKALREGGRLAYVVPDSFFYPAKAKLRRRLLELGHVEKVLNLGPDWFGPTVRMSTVLLQVRKGGGPPPLTFQGTLLAGRLRRQAVAGQLPLRQVEAQRSRELPSTRTLDSPTRDIEVFRGSRDDSIIEQIESSSVRLADLCDRARGEEINKAGLLWRCPGCLVVTAPGVKKKGGGYDSKECPTCNLNLTSENVDEAHLVASEQPAGRSAPYLDGDDLRHRYQVLEPQRWLRLDETGWPYKDDAIYEDEKILVRQAGVGIVASLDATSSRVPQSVYVYRTNDSAAGRGISNAFLLAALASRTMTYLIFKRFAEIDPAKAHAKLTHARLAQLPIPDLDLRLPAHQQAHSTIVQSVHRLVAGESELGGVDDLRIELELRRLWGLSAGDGAYINGEFFDLPDSQAIRDLFPGGVPGGRTA